MRWMIITVVCLGGCGLVPDGGAIAPETGTNAAVEAAAETAVRPQSRPIDGISTPPASTPPTSQPEVSVGTLGRSVASLGNAAEPGLWLKTPLVGATRQGRVYFPQTGKSVAVTLIPIEGPATAGSRLSLAAMQGLGASLTDLVEVDVFGS